MAIRIPQYDQRTTPSTGGVQASARGMPVSDASARAVEGLGQAAGQFADILLKKEADDAVSDAGKKVSDATVHWSEYYQNASQNAPPGAPGFTGKMLTDFDAYAEETLKGIPHPTARKVASRNMLALRESLQLKSMAFEAQAGVTKRTTDLEGSVNNYGRIVAADPTQREFAEKAVLDQIANGGFGQQAPEMANRAKQALDVATWTGLVQRDPTGAKRALEFSFGINQPVATTPEAAAPVTVASVWSKLERQESGGKQGAVSSAGAVGVAQVMPGTGPEAAKLAGLPWDPAKFKTDAAYNRALGQAYLAKQLKDFGSMDKALAAYNAGPGRVREALAKGEAGWLSRMPAETRSYVPGILGAPEASAAPADPQTPPANPQYIEWAKRLTTQQAASFLTAAESEVNRQQAGARSNIENVITSHIAGAQNGVVPTQPLTEQQFTLALGGEQGRLRFAQYQQQMQTGADINAMRTMTPLQAKALIDRTAPPPNSDDPLYAGAVQRQAQLKEAYDRVRTIQTADPIAYAMEVKIGGKPLNFQDSKAMSEELASRVGLATTMRDSYYANKDFKLLTNNEAEALGTMFAGQAVAGQKQLLQVLRSSVQDDNAFHAILQQIRPNSPATEVAGRFMVLNDPKRTGGGWWSDERVYKPADVAGTILEGERLLNPIKADRADNGKGGFPMPSDDDLRTDFADAVGAAFGSNADGANSAYQAYKAYYAGRAAQDGDYSGKVSKKLSKEALAAVLPGVSDINGKGEVFRPYAMGEDTFEQALQNGYGEFMQQQGLAGTEIDNFNAWQVMSLPNNRYAFRAGDFLRYVSGPKKGQAYIVDMGVAPSSAGRINRAPAVAPTAPTAPSVVKVAK